MATTEQKQELIEILKFTPRTYKIELGAYGGECYFGKVDRKIYDFFKEHKIDLDEYASDWDEDKWDFIPEDLRPFPPGAPYDGRNAIQCSGATLDGANYLTVYDENGNQVFQCSLDLEDLDNHGVQVHCWEEEYVDNYDDGTVVFWGGQGEKGLCFGGEIELKTPFDPKKIKLNYSDADGWCIVNGVEYEEEDVDNGDYSTTGKWGENKWIIVGDTEEVYEGVSRDDIEPEELEWTKAEITPDLQNHFQVALGNDPILTDWFEKDVKPAYKGEYEVSLDAEWPMGGIVRAGWTGRTWKDADGNKVKIRGWRGLAENPNEA